MSFSQSTRFVLPLLAGLVLGGAGAMLFQQSLPGSAGSPEERAEKLEVQLKQAQNRLSALEAKDAGDNRRSLPGDKNAAAATKRTLASIAQDIREGRLVSPDDIFKASQPFLRDVAPLFDRMRVTQQQRMIDGLTGEMARKYHLSPPQKDALAGFFRKKLDTDAGHWNDLVARDGTTLEDIMKASSEVRPDEGLDAFMPTILSGNDLAAFQTQRTTERADRVQQEADAQVQRLDALVGLDEAQRDQVFGVVAHTSREYQPGMIFEGAGGQVVSSPGGDRQAAIRSLLRPDQRTKYDAERERRRAEAARQLAAMGLATPAGGGFFDEDGFQ